MTFLPAFPVSPSLLVVLVVIAFFAGVGITTLGPGGIFLTIALYALTPLSTSTIAGTAQVAFIATGIVGTTVYLRSGELTDGPYLTLTVILSGASICGAFGGALLNASLSRALYGGLLGALAGLTGCIIIYREKNGFESVRPLDASTASGKLQVALLGIFLGGVSGLLGIGGPVLAVPALVLVGVPMLFALAIAQVQSIGIAVFASLGYLTQGAISVPLAILIGIPLLAGVITGWGVAHRIDPDRLKAGLGGVLLLVGPFLAL